MAKMLTSTPEVLAQLAAIRLLLQAGGLEALFTDGRLQDRRLLRQLPLSQDMVDAPSLTLLREALSKRLGMLGSITKKLPRRAPLFRNLTWLGDSMGLNPLERDIILLMALASSSDVLRRTLELLGHLRLQDVIRLLSMALNVPEEQVTEALSLKSRSRRPSP